MAGAAGQHPPPVVVVHDLHQALAAARISRERGRALLLASAAGAGATVGPGWWAALIAAVSAAVPGAPVDWLLDCADEPGMVLAALRRGIREVGFAGAPGLTARLAAIAEAQGARLVAPPQADLDLRDAPEPETALLRFLTPSP